MVADGKCIRHGSCIDLHFHNQKQLSKARFQCFVSMSIDFLVYFTCFVSKVWLMVSISTWVLCLLSLITFKSTCCYEHNDAECHSFCSNINAMPTSRNSEVAAL